jgi:uncharacterized membrane protein
MKYSAKVVLILFGLFAISAMPLWARPKDPFSTRPVDRILNAVDDSARVRLPGNVHPLAKARYDEGAVEPEFRMERMVLLLQPSSEQQAALDELVAAQHDPNSVYYHRWLTPEEYGERFGLSVADLATVENWLLQHGFEIEEVADNRRSITFHGSAAQVSEAFSTEIHRYNVNGSVHYANASTPQIPAAMAGVVGGVVSLHNFESAPQLVPAKVSPQYTTGTLHYMAPGDFATIYNAASLYTSGVDGSGESIAVIARSNLKLSDVRTFRTNFGLAANDPAIVLTGSDPGTSNTSDLYEVSLDTEWAGAVARKAAVKVVVSASTNTSDGIFLSAQYAVNKNVAPIITLSYGSCEASLGTTGNAFFNTLWQQAAAQGISVFVSAGDSGAAGCDSDSASKATGGKAINGLCSSPYSTCVGGTMFTDTSSPSSYWGTTNTSYASALSYIPEVAWNESSTGLWATGGGVSTIYSKPSWQNVTGVPSDGMRDVPDVSLSASSHDSYLVYVNGGLGAVGGTSAATPSFAGIMALVLQSTGATQGNANAKLYAMAAEQYAYGSTAPFHDITSGNNSVPGVIGYSAGTGYDPVTGLGSVDAAKLVSAWGGVTATPTLSVSLSSSSMSLNASSLSGSATVTTAVGGGLSSAVTLSVSGAPAGLTAAFSPATIAAPGSGTSTLKLTAASTLAAGTYAVTVTATASGLTKSATVMVTVTRPSLSVSLSSSAIGLNASSLSGSTTVTTTVGGGLSSAVTLSVSGAPTGLTATFSPATIAAPGSGTSTLTVTAASTLSGTYTLTVTATAPGLISTATVTVTVTKPSLAMSLSNSSMSLNASSPSNSTTVTTTVGGGLNRAVTLSVSGAPTGLTAAFSSATIAAPGSGTSTLTVTAASTLAAGTYTLTVTAAASGLSSTAKLTVTVTKPSLSVRLINSLVSLNASTLSSSTTVVATGGGGLNSAVALSLSGAPAGLTVALSPATIAAPGSGTSTLTVTAASTLAAGNYTVTVTAAASGLTSTAKLTVTVAKAALAVSISASQVSVKGTAVGGGVSVKVSGSGGLNSAVALSVSGLPSGLTATLSSATIAAPGTGSSSLTVQAGKTLASGNYTVTVTATASGLVSTATMTVKYTKASATVFQKN